MTLDVPSVKWAVITATTAAKQCSWQPALNQGLWGRGADPGMELG